MRLDNCHICGGKAIIFEVQHGYKVECLTCGGCLTRLTRAYAVEAWNNVGLHPCIENEEEGEEE